MPVHGSKTSTVPVVTAAFGIFRRNPSDFLSQLVTMDETWLYHYDPETKQQSLDWWHSSSPRPKKIPSAKIHLTFWDRDGVVLIAYLPKGQTINMQYYSSLLVQLKDSLKEKCCGKVMKGGSRSCTTMPQLTRHFQPRRNWPTWASSVLVTHPILWIWPRQTTTCSLHRKNN